MYDREVFPPQYTCDMKGLNPDQLDVVFLEHKRSAVIGVPGCLAGNTVMHYQRGAHHGGRKITLRDLYLKFNGLPASSRPWSNGFTTYLYSRQDSGIVAFNEVLAVMHSGVRECIRLEADDRSFIDCTPDHPFLTEDEEYLPAESLLIEDVRVMRVGSMKPVARDGKKPGAKRVTVYTKHHPYGKRIRKVQEGGCVCKQVRRSRLVVEAYLNGISFEDMVSILKHDADAAAQLSYLEPGIEVHHKDGNSLNDDLANLEILSHEEHARKHALLGNKFNKDYSKCVRIVSIKGIGKQETFDVSMAAPHHNFAASGFIVHNSGKTHTLIMQLARAFYNGLPQEQVLCMTFTKNAGEELKERLAAYGFTDCRVGTIHSLCQEIITSDQTSPMHQGDKPPTMDNFGVMAVELRKLRTRFIQERKFQRQRGITTEALSKYIAATKAHGYATVLPTQAHDVVLSDGAWKLAKHWGQHLRVATDHLILFQQAMEETRLRRDMYDFDDMLLWAWRSLVFNPACLNEYRNRFSHIIVDEVQDSNQLQWDIAHLLSGEASQIITNEPFDADKSYDTTVYDPSRFSPPKAMPPELRGTLIVYGDPAQSIYEFRHARPSKLLAFTQRVDVDVYQLRYNYRSTQGICKLGETIARGKPWNISDCILPVGQNRQVKALASISTYASVSLMEESERIVQEAITKAGQHPEGLNACAVLCRVSIPLCFVELACMKMGIPWVKYASGSFMDSKDIKLVLSYMQAGMGSTYDPGGEILLSLVNKPFRFIKKSFVDSCAKDALGRNTHPIDILQERRDELRPMPQEALNDFISLMTQLNRMAFTLEAQGQSGADKKELPTGARSMIRLILRETDYVRKLREEDGPSAEADRLSALEELLKIADNFEKPSEFLQHIQELRETMKQISLHKKAQKGSRKPKLTLSTIHRAKGLEWPHVFLMGVNHGIFPHGMADIEEETRLFYVAATRAKSTLTVTHTNAHASLDAESDEQEATSPFIEIVKSFLDYEDLRLKLLANSAGVSRAS